MPAVDFRLLIPAYPLHWTTIVHYLLLLGTLMLLLLAGDRASLIYILVLAVEALLIGADLYTHLIAIPRVFTFLNRVVIFGIPVAMTGMAGTEEARTVGGIMAVAALPLLVVTFITCWLGPLGDPRLLAWC